MCGGSVGLAWRRRDVTLCTAKSCALSLHVTPPCPKAPAHEGLARACVRRYRRIVGELANLHLPVGRSSIRRILQEEGMFPAPTRRGGSAGETPWRKFIRLHLNTLVACDFFTKSVITPVGMRTAYCLFFIHLASARHRRHLRSRMRVEGDIGPGGMQADFSAWQLNSCAAASQRVSPASRRRRREYAIHPKPRCRIHRARSLPAPIRRGTLASFCSAANPGL